MLVSFVEDLQLQALIQEKPLNQKQNGLMIEEIGLPMLRFSDVGRHF